MAVSFSRPALPSQDFIDRCKKEDKIRKDLCGRMREVQPSDIAKRLSALWTRACSNPGWASCSVSWKEANVNFAGERRVVPLDLWLEDKTDLLLMCASQPSLPPCLSIPNVQDTEPRHVN